MEERPAAPAERTEERTAGTKAKENAGSAGKAGKTGEADEPRASGFTTAVLYTALVIVVVLTGVLAAIAVLMTTNPDALPGAERPRKLAVPIYFAPIIRSQPAPCPGVRAALDRAGTTCYEVGAGVEVTAVHTIETVPERDGTYAVRVALPSPFRERVSDLTRETVDKQIAILAGQRLVATPTVTQPITVDSLSIAGGFSKETADTLVAELLGTATPQPTLTGPAGTGDPGTGNPGMGNPGTGNPGTGNPGTGNFGTDNPGTGNPGMDNPGTGGFGTDNPPATGLSSTTPARQPVGG